MQKSAALPIPKPNINDNDEIVTTKSFDAHSYISLNSLIEVSNLESPSIVRTKEVPRLPLDVVSEEEIVNEPAVVHHEGMQWYQGITKQQWLALVAACMGWLFDMLDVKIYSMIQGHALSEVLNTEDEDTIGYYAGVIFSVYLVGWAIGGVIFGILADYYGRVKMLTVTIVLYTTFSAVTAVASTWWQLMLFRFLGAIGTGGEWALGATLVHEEWPERTRPIVGAILQSSAAIGFLFASLLHLLYGTIGWRWMLVIGILPAVAALFIRLRVREPQSWLDLQEQRAELQQHKEEGLVYPQEVNLHKFTLSLLFTDKKVFKDVLIGFLLALVCIFGSWASAEWAPAILRDSLESTDRYTPSQTENMISYALITLNIGALAGYLSFGHFAAKYGRKKAIAGYFIGNAVWIPLTFWMALTYMPVGTLIAVCIPGIGFFSYGVYSAFPIYLPELFPTHIRSTAVGFCYNAGRLIASSGPLLTGVLVGAFHSYGTASSMSAIIYVLGLVVVYFARETNHATLTPQLSPRSQEQRIGLLENT